MRKESAFTGLEAAIVLIAFVVVAAVFSYVMLGAGFFATQKSQEVTYSGIKQTTSNLVLDGYLYGDGSTITQLTFYVKIPEGGEPLKVSETAFLFARGGTIASESNINTGTSTIPTGNLIPGDRTKIVLGIVSGAQPGPGSKFTLEIKPKIGASTLVVRTLASGYDGGVIL